MGYNKVVLGLDVGVGSIGWGLVQLDEEKYADEKQDGTVEEKYKITDGKIIAAGVRRFQLPQDRQKKSLALIRGTARRSRRTIKRRARRLKRLIELGKEFNLLGNDFDRDKFLIPKKGDKKEKWDTWRFRKEALERKLTDEEFFRVLYHIAKHRGAYFQTRAERLELEKDSKAAKDQGEKGEEKQDNEKKKEREKMKKGLKRIQELLKRSQYKTVGAMFYEMFKNGRKRNAPDKYSNSIRRELLHDEINEIFKAQRALGNEKADPDLEKQYLRAVLMQEKGPDDEKMQKMIGRCEIIKELCSQAGKECTADCPDLNRCRCAPKESYTAERFVLFNRLNSLKIIGGQAIDLAKHRDNIEKLAYTHDKIDFSQIRKELCLTDKPHLRFNLCSYSEKNPEYEKTLKYEVSNGQLQFGPEHRVQMDNFDTGETKVFDKEIRAIFQKRLATTPNYKKINVRYSDIRKELQGPQVDLAGFKFTALKKEYTKSSAQLESEFFTKPKNKGKNFNGDAAYIKQFEDDAIFVELKGYHKIRKVLENRDGTWEKLKSDGTRIDTIAEALTYCKKDETRTAYLKERGITDESVIDAALTLNMEKIATYSKEAMVKLLEHMEKGLLVNDAKARCGYDKFEHKKQAYLAPYSGFFENNPVVARVIAQTRKVVNAIVRKYGEQYPIDQIHIEVATELANSEKTRKRIKDAQDKNKDEKSRARSICEEFGINSDEGQNLTMVRLLDEQGHFCPYTGKAIVLRSTGAANEVHINDCEIDHIIPMSRSFNDGMNNKILCCAKANQDKRNRIPFEWFEETHGPNSQQWFEFTRRVEKMYDVPYSKKKNLLRKSWTDEEMKKFMDRNLNDTRYATRHIADYLRKYFDFSNRRDDIKDVSRIKLRSGGVTAFLRYLCGLNKNRDENDLHHATDALITACATDGHVFLVSNLSKQIEEKGKNWYKHFGMEKFKPLRPWETVREDILEATQKIFVSRMPRHKVTSAAHEDEVWSFDEKKRTKKAQKKKKSSIPKDTARVMKINNGYAKIGEIVRADVFEDGKHKNYVVPIYAVDIFSKKPLPDKYLKKNNTPYDEWPSAAADNLTFKFSLFKDDLITINGTPYYVDFVEGTQANIKVRNINGSKFESTNEKTRKFGYRNIELKKFSVDMLGNYKEVKEEKRLGNEGVKWTKKRPKK